VLTVGLGLLLDRFVALTIILPREREAQCGGRRDLLRVSCLADASHCAEASRRKRARPVIDYRPDPRYAYRREVSDRDREPRERRSLASSTGNFSGPSLSPPPPLLRPRCGGSLLAPGGGETSARDTDQASSRGATSRLLNHHHFSDQPLAGRGGGGGGGGEGGGAA